MKKKLLFVINTMGIGGAEKALVLLLKSMDPEQYDISLYSLMGQGEFYADVPKYVKILNSKVDLTSVHTAKGRVKMARRVLACAVRRASAIQLLPYLIRNYVNQFTQKHFAQEKPIWRLLANGAERFEATYDIAIAFIEGGATYYVAEHVKAAMKVAFVHVDYEKAGYSRQLDLGAYEAMDHILFSYEGLMEPFLRIHPNEEKKCRVFDNLLGEDDIRLLSKEEPSLDLVDPDIYTIVSVGRLVKQKGYDLAIDACRELVLRGKHFRWIVLGEGELRKSLERKVRRLGLGEVFQMPGEVANPYAFVGRADLFVHSSLYEGQSTALREAMILEKEIVATSCDGNRQVLLESCYDEERFRLCEMDGRRIAEEILAFMK